MRRNKPKDIVFITKTTGMNKIMIDKIDKETEKLKMSFSQFVRMCIDKHLDEV